MRYRVFENMTRGTDMGRASLNSMGLAALCTLFTVPYFRHLILAAPVQGRWPSHFGPHSLLLFELFLLFVVCLLSSMAGFTFSKRVGLIGFGQLKNLLEAIPRILIFAGLTAGLSYWLFDRPFMETSPASYPKDLLFILAYPFKGALTDETILRFSMVTLVVGIFKRKGLAVFLVSAVASIFTLKYFMFFGIDLSQNNILLRHFLVSFPTHLILGYLFVSRGLVCAMALKFLLGIKYVVVILWAA